MASEILLKNGTPIVWRGAGGDYGISLESVVAAAAEQGGKGDLGATRADEYDVELRIETGAGAPTAGGTYDLYWAASAHATPATDNPGGCSGVDAAYTGTAAGSIPNSVKALTLIGRLPVTNDASTILIKHFILVPEARYGMPVLVNNTDGTTETNHDEHSITLTPRILEVQ